MADITLYQFAGSHFNEKARWALDLKGVDHDRVSLMPGPHAPQMKKLTGRTETPVLVDGEKVVAGSTAIVTYLDERFPSPALQPTLAADRERASAIVREFDDEVGPAVRLAKFFEILDADFAVGAFCADRSTAVKLSYRLFFPVIFQVMKHKMKINAENANRDRERTRQALDYVAKQSEATGYLVGDSFTIADLTCAALLIPAVDVGDLGGPALTGTPKEAVWYARWSDHPGSAWVRKIFRDHRGA